MKFHLSTWLMSILMAALVSFSSVMCLVDCYRLDCRLEALFFVCFAAALAFSSAMLPKRTGWMTLGAAVLWLGWIIWQREEMFSSLLALLYAVTDRLSDYYVLVDAIGESGSCIPAIYALVLPMIWTTAWIICRQGNTLILVLLCLPVLVLSLVIVDLAPVFWLVLLTFCLLVLMMSHGVRERSAREAAHLAWWLLLPAVILVAGITVLWPPADYERSDWVTELQGFAESKISLETIQEEVSSVQTVSRSLEEVELDEIGPKAMTGRRVLQYQAETKIRYLRGASMGEYEDNTWKRVEEDLPEDYGIERDLPGTAEEDDCLLQVTTMREDGVLFYPYYSAAMLSHENLIADGWVQNRSGLREYAVTYSDRRFTPELTADYEAFVYDFYTQVPEDLREELQVILENRGWNGADPEELAGLVQNSAVYDLDTPEIPEGADFVLYFLQESDRGYCVHFASSTVMLLRTMGVPARYVTGYVAGGIPNQWNAVTEDDAHAWVEYYKDGTGWLPLDPTPLEAFGEEEELPSAPEEEQEEQESPPEETPPEEEPEEEQPEPEPEPEEELVRLPQPASEARSAWLWLLTIPLVLAIFPLRRWLILRRRKALCRTGHPNRRALALWRWLVLLAKAEDAYPEEELFALAEKARFSQHTLTEEELSVLQAALEKRVQNLKGQGIWKSLRHRFGQVLY